jgi:hypothetical protein
MGLFITKKASVEAFLLFKTHLKNYNDAIAAA